MTVSCLRIPTLWRYLTWCDSGAPLPRDDGSLVGLLCAPWDPLLTFLESDPTRKENSLTSPPI